MNPILSERICACLADAQARNQREIRRLTACGSEWLFDVTLERLVEEGRVEKIGPTYRLPGVSPRIPSAQDFTVTSEGNRWRLWASGVATADFSLKRRAEQCAAALVRRGIDPRQLKSPKLKDQFLGLVCACEGEPLVVAIPGLGVARKLQEQPTFLNRDTELRPGRPAGVNKALEPYCERPPAVSKSAPSPPAVLTASMASPPLPVHGEVVRSKSPATAEQFVQVRKLAMLGLKA